MARLLLRRRRLIVAALTCTVLLAALVTWLQPRVYESEATVRIDEEEPALSLLNRLAPAGLGGMVGLARNDVQTDIAELRSRRIAEAVVDTLRLQVQLVQPDSARDHLIRVVRVDPEAPPARIRLLQLPDGGYRVTAEGRRGASPAAPLSVRQGEEFSIAGAVLLIEPSSGAAVPQMVLTVRPFWKAVEEMQKAIRIERPDPTAQVVAIRYRDRDPVLTAAVPNAASTTFLRFKTETNREKSHGTVDFLQEQIAHYSPALSTAEARLQRYREQAQIISPKDQAAEELRRVAELHVKRDMLRTEQHSLRELLTRSAGSSAPTSARSLARDLASHPLFLANGAVQDVLKTMSDLETQRSTLAVRRTDANIDVRAIDARVEELEDQLLRLARGYSRSLDTQIAAMDGILAQSAHDLGTIPAREAEFLRLTREQKLLEEVLMMLQTKLKEEEIQASSESSNVRLLDSALIPRYPVAPRPLLNLLIALVVGGVVGVGLAFGRDALDDAVHSEEEVRHVTGARIVGMIPDSRATPPHSVVNGRNAGRRWISVLSPLQLFRAPSGDPRTQSDAYREIVTALRLGELDGPRTLVIAGTGDDSSRSAVTSGLAQQLARRRKTVLLVDADPQRRAGSVAPWSLTRPTEGVDEETWNAAIRRYTDAGTGVSLDVLICGGADAEIDASDPARLGILLQRFGSRYDAVIIDAPSFSSSSDAAVLGRFADSTILVAQSGKTDRGSLSRAVARLQQLEVPFGGIVLVDPQLGLNGSSPFALARWSDVQSPP